MSDRTHPDSGSNRTSMKLNDVQRAQRFADRWKTLPVSQQDAVRAAFRAGLRAERRDHARIAKANIAQMRAMFFFLARRGLWEEFTATKAWNDCPKLSLDRHEI